VEGMSRSKAEIINQLFGDPDVLTNQETHMPADQAKQLNINDFQLVNFIGHPNIAFERRVESVYKCNVESINWMCELL